MRRAILYSLFDASWFLAGLALWLVLLGAGEITTRCNATGHAFRFPGWLAGD
ncbi:MAG TPA: hypothetical protein VN436_02290 [Holophaga sp.]|nr:hypothetical protein [Holophaga sp.]